MQSGCRWWESGFLWLLTCFQAAPGNLLEEGLALQHVAGVVAEAEAFGRVLLHQALAEVLAFFGELWSVGNCIVEDPASYLRILNLDGKKWTQHFHHMKDSGWSWKYIWYLLSSHSEGAFGGDHLIQSNSQSEVVHRVVVLLLLQQFRSHETCSHVVLNIQCVDLRRWS